MYVSSERMVVIAENPRAGSGEGQTLVERLADELSGRGFQVVREREPERIRSRLQPVG